ncbi:MAG: hypothetical protein IT379_17735 [Deltaproteobacteria bacterium]|nr:hypothetical protein [Deltaproteobacteria bacterium]
MDEALPPTGRDPYADLLRDTRGLKREHALARETWFAALGWEHKDDTLFELEMLLKGLVCFGNIQNHPGPASRTPAVAHDFHEELRIAREALDRAVTLLRSLLGNRDRAYTFQRYLETVLPEDGARTRLVRDTLTQDTPEEALFVLRNAFGAVLEIIDGLSRLGRIPHRLFGAVMATLTREVGRNTYFNPLQPLEFRPEFDRIRSVEVLETIQRVRMDAAHRTVALTFLALFRMLRYITLIEAIAAKPGQARRAYVLLAVLRSDVRALVGHLRSRVGDVLANGLERELMKVPAAELPARFSAIAEEIGWLRDLRTSLVAVGSHLRVEIRKAFEQDLPPPDAGVRGEDLGPVLVVVTAELRNAIHQSIRTLCFAVDRDATLPALADEAAERRASSERIRRDVWMFIQVLRAFLTKAHAAVGGVDHWGGTHSLLFVKDFASYFQQIGYQLMRTADYPRYDAFVGAVHRVRDVDLLDPERLNAVVSECAAFLQFLEALHEAIGRRSDLAGTEFDRRAAAERLRLYLSSSGGVSSPSAGAD